MFRASEDEAKSLLARTLDRYTPEELARRWDIDLKTLDRWSRGSIPRAGMLVCAASYMLQQAADYVADRPANFTFIDLFAGIGGTRLGFEAAGGRCVFTSEWDRFCQQTYRANFRPTHAIAGDIRAVRTSDVPDHDVLVAGFPCQPFSVAGVSKKNSLGRKHGFACETQGTLFFEIERILEEKRPHAFLLENVKNLKSHDKGRTLEVILRVLNDKLGYDIDYRVIDARAFVPQHRERVFIVGFRRPTAFAWDQVELPQSEPRLGTILHAEDGSEPSEEPYTHGPRGTVDARYTLSKKLWKYLRDYALKHQLKGNGFGYGLFGPDDVARTLSARYYKDGSEILISRGPRSNPRRLTPRECARLMGFSDGFKIPVSDTQAYKQFGNSVVVPVIEAIAKAMYPHVMTLKDEMESQQVAMVV
jgi:DNA (cytosine-5)-methyltransferase 1